jgi:hypothetical protein
MSWHVSRHLAAYQCCGRGQHHTVHCSVCSIAGPVLPVLPVPDTCCLLFHSQAVQVNYTTSVAYRGMEQAWYNPSVQGHRHAMLTHHAHQ